MHARITTYIRLLAIQKSHSWLRLCLLDRFLRKDLPQSSKDAGLRSLMNLVRGFHAGSFERNLEVTL
jgi:hypothetical protein